jgi:CelD/BcsL family acetyltransferase involved in cellulose biosynthesis
VAVLDGLRIEVARDFPEVEAAWRTASAHLASYVFQCYDWLAIWNAAAGAQERTQPLLVRVTDSEGRIVLLLPLGMRLAYGCRTLIYLGGLVSDYNAPLIDRPFAVSCGPADFAKLWQAILRRLPPADLVWLVRMPQTIEGVPNPMVALRHSVRTGTAYAASPLPASFKAYTESHRSNVFRDAARKRRKVEALGPVSFEVLETSGDIRETVEIALAQKFRRHSETGQVGLGPAYESFYKRIATAQLDAGRAHVSRLRVGDAVVATHVGAVQGSRFYWLLPGYEGGTWARYSVGRLLQQEIVKWCIAQRLETFDMTGGDEEYKHVWADAHLSLYACKYALTRKGRIAMALVGAAEFARERAKRSPRTHARLRSLKHGLSAVRRNLRRSRNGAPP